MKIVIIGGTGLIGSKTVDRLRKQGHEVIAASPNTGVNTITGEGLAEALAGTDVVIDLANSPSFEDKAVMEFFETSGRNLMAAEKVAGVKHHIALSVVGTERLQESGYFRAKLAQERLIKASSLPYTIVHSTQFMEFLSGALPSPAPSARRCTCPPPMCSRSPPTTWRMPWQTLPLLGPSMARSRLPDPSGRGSATSSVAI
ncbi:uncharacterized protein YbjT (DUF2867 family) [Sinorhizobium fredii]